jgi:hypothetical protein
MRLVSVILAAVVLAGCSGSHTSSSTDNASTAGATSTTVSEQQRIAWKPLLTLHQLGEFETRCTRRRFATSFTAAIASERVRVVGVPQEGPHVLQPGQTWYSPPERNRSVVWQVTQATEPQTIKATVWIRPSRCPYGIPKTRVFYGTASVNSP